MSHLSEIKGLVSIAELAQISIWAKQVPANGVILEFGSYHGLSSVCWAMNCDPSITIYCVDKFTDENDKDIYGEFLKNTSAYKNIIPIIGKSPNIDYNGSLLDLFFMDAAHRNPECIINLMFYKKFMKDTGIICGHDYNDYWPDVKITVNAVAKILNKKVKLYEGTSLWELID
jgi:predicted O-methyltransferase YrrM